MKEFLTAILKPTFWQILARLTMGVASFILTLILTRSLGVENFGNFAKILALVTIFYLPADFGLNAAFIKLAVKAGEVKRLFFNLFSIRLFWSVVLIFASFLFGASLYFPSTALFLAAVTILTTSTATTAQGYFQLKLDYFWFFLANFLGAILTLFLVLVFSPNLHLAGAFLAILAGQLLSSVVSLGRIWLELKSFWEKLDFILVKKLFLSSFAVGLVLIFNLVYFKADIIILSVLKTSTSVGLYGLAVRIFEWAILPPVLLLNAAFPLLTRTFFTDFEKFKKITKSASLILVFAGGIVFLLVFSLSDWLVTFVGGENFERSAVGLKILAIGIPIFYLTGLLMWLLVILEKKLGLILIYGVGAILNIILNLIFIPRFDFAAAATITVMVEGLILLASAVFFLKQFKNFK